MQTREWCMNMQSGEIQFIYCSIYCYLVAWCNKKQIIGAVKSFWRFVNLCLINYQIKILLTSTIITHKQSVVKTNTNSKHKSKVLFFWTFSNIYHSKDRNWMFPSSDGKVPTLIGLETWYVSIFRRKGAYLDGSVGISFNHRTYSTSYIVANSLNLPMWSRCWALCGLMTRFSLHLWDSSWWFVLLPPPWGEEASDKDRGPNCAAQLDRADHNQSINCSQNESKAVLFSVCCL